MYAARTRTPNLRIKSPLLCSILLLELLSSNVSPCRELPFCPVARIRAALRIPGGAGPYRGIRATTEQPSMRIGLDHCGRGCLRRSLGEGVGVVGKGIAAWHDVMR